MEVPPADAGLGVVSLDPFDTLLMRPFVRPMGLFRLMEQLYDIPGFADRRIRERGHGLVEQAAYVLPTVRMGHVDLRYLQGSLSIQ